MPTYQPAKLMRLHFSEHHRYQGKPLYEAIVEKCLEIKIAGATVLRGLEGYGGMAQIHRSHLLKHDLPTIVTIVDSAENIDRLTPVVEGMMETGLIAVSDVQIKRIQKSKAAGDAQ
jgi:PII-like signaling protein